ncbi:MAG: hypothetical protein AAF703_02995 [Cyanobacteria bacterium P01_D01_bin.105]
MFLLTPSDVEIVQIKHPTKSAKKIPILSYDNQTFRLLSVFPAQQVEDAHADWQARTEKQNRPCVLLEEPTRYTVWQQVNIDMSALQLATPKAHSKACVLMVQTLYGDVEQLLGSRQAKSFGIALTKQATPQVHMAGGLGNLLRLDPRIDVLPMWEEEDLSALLLALHRLGAKFFGRAQFTQRTLQSLDELDAKDKSLFLNWLTNLTQLNQLWL